MTTKSYSNDIRSRIIRAVKGGLSARAAAEKYEVSASCAIKLVKRWRESGSYAAKKRGGYRRPALEEHKEWLCGLVEQYPDWTLQEITTHLAREKSLKVHLSTVGRYLDSLDLSYKKKRARRRTGPAGRERGPGRLAGTAEKL